MLITIKMRRNVQIKVSVGYFISFLFLFHHNSPLLSAAKQYIQRYLYVRSALLSATKRLIICATYLLCNKCRTPVQRKLPCWLLREALFVCLFVVLSQSVSLLCSEPNCSSAHLSRDRSSSLAIDYPAPTTVSLAKSTSFCFRVGITHVNQNDWLKQYYVIQAFSEMRNHGNLDTTFVLRRAVYESILLIFNLTAILFSILCGKYLFLCNTFFVLHLGNVTWIIVSNTTN